MDANELMTIRDLAERWGVSVDKAKKHVRRCGMPFLKIDSNADMLVNWGTARFRLASVLKWEEESEQVFEEPGPAQDAKPRQGAAKKYKFVKRQPA